MSDYDKGLLRAAEICAEEGNEWASDKVIFDKNYAHACRDRIRAEASQPASQPDSVAVPLSKKHEGMRISASGLLGRIRDGRYDQSHKFGCGEMLRHLEETAEKFYLGNLASVDEFLQFYCLDDKRPDAMLRAAKEPTK